MTMQNIRIESQKRTVKIGRKTVEYFNVIADTERFGKDEILCQGTFEQCIEWLKSQGYDYTKAALEQNRGRDIQVKNSMFKITAHNGNELSLEGRTPYYSHYTIDITNLVPVAPNVFKLTVNPFYRLYKLEWREWAKTRPVTVKLGSAKAW